MIRPAKGLSRKRKTDLQACAKDRLSDNPIDVTLYLIVWGFLMRIFLSKAAGVLAIFGALSVAVPAWDDAGHKLSAYIAWEAMTSEVRSEAVRILLAAPEDSDLSVLYNAFDSRSREARDLELFMYAATWPDVIRNREFKTRYEKYHRGNWHYGGIFWKGKGDVLEDFPEPSGIAVTKLRDFEMTLRDANSPDAEKAVALAWFLHVAADLHNPLHNASRVTESEPKGDQGGNFFHLEPAKADGSWRLNLHSYWDSLITTNLRRDNDECDRDYLSPIVKLELALNPQSMFEDHLDLGKYESWNREAFAFLPEAVYGNGLQRDALPDENYRRQAFGLAFAQIALAGYRIGGTMNSVLRPARTASAAPAGAAR